MDDLDGNGSQLETALPPFSNPERSHYALMGLQFSLNMERSNGPFRS